MGGFDWTDQRFGPINPRAAVVCWLIIVAVFIVKWWKEIR